MGFFLRIAAEVPSAVVFNVFYKFKSLSIPRVMSTPL